MSELSFAQYEQMTADDRAHYHAAIEDTQPVLDLSKLETAMGTASLGDILCKIWRAIVKVAKAVVDGVKEVLKDLVSAVFDLLGDIIDGADSLFDGLFDSPLLWIAGGALLWYFFGKDDEESPPTYIGGQP